MNLNDIFESMILERCQSLSLIELQKKKNQDSTHHKMFGPQSQENTNIMKVSQEKKNC